MVANTNLLRANHGATWVAAASMILIAGTPGWSQSGRGNVPASSAAYEQPLRPQFHWTPKTDYTNDPNGLFYYKGEYHLFYQAREFSDLDTPEWGHAVSTDLVHWTQLPVAIPKVPGVTFEQGYGKRICSGSAVVDWNNTSGFGTKDNPPLVAMYTDPCIDGTYAWQAQSIAYSVDNGRTWTKYAGNPVIDIKARGFRDPKVIWYEPAKRWIALVTKFRWPLVVPLPLMVTNVDDTSLGAAVSTVAGLVQKVASRVAKGDPVPPANGLPS